MKLEIYFKAELTCDCRNNNNDPQEKCNCETYLDIQHFDIAGVSFLDVVNDMGKFHCPPELFEDELFGIVEKIRDSIKLKKTKDLNMELCNCEQSLEYKRLLEKSERLCDLIEFWTNWGSNELIEGRTEFEFMAEVIVPLADELQNQIMKLKSEGGDLMERTTHFTKDSKGKTAINSMVVLKEEDYKHLRSLLMECFEWFKINRHSWNCLRNVGDGSDSDFCNCEAPELREKIENELKGE